MVRWFIWVSPKPSELLHNRDEKNNKDRLPTFCNGPRLRTLRIPPLRYFVSLSVNRARVCTLSRLYCGYPPLVDEKGRGAGSNGWRLAFARPRASRGPPNPPFSYGVRVEHVAINNLLGGGSKPAAYVLLHYIHLLLVRAHRRELREQSSFGTRAERNNQ